MSNCKHETAIVVSTFETLGLTQMICTWQCQQPFWMLQTGLTTQEIPSEEAVKMITDASKQNGLEDEISEEKATETVPVEINKKMLAVLNEVFVDNGFLIDGAIEKALVYYLKDYSRETRDWFVYGVIG